VVRTTVNFPVVKRVGGQLDEMRLSHSILCAMNLLPRREIGYGTITSIHPFSAWLMLPIVRAKRKEACLFPQVMVYPLVENKRGREQGQIGLTCQRCQRRSASPTFRRWVAALPDRSPGGKKDEGWSPPSTEPTPGHLPERRLAASRKDNLEVSSLSCFL